MNPEVSVNRREEKRRCRKNRKNDLGQLNGRQLLTQLASCKGVHFPAPTASFPLQHTNLYIVSPLLGMQLHSPALADSHFSRRQRPLTLTELHCVCPCACGLPPQPTAGVSGLLEEKLSSTSSKVTVIRPQAWTSQFQTTNL